MTRPGGVRRADRIDPQLLSQFASEVRVSAHVTEGIEPGRGGCEKRPGRRTGPVWDDPRVTYVAPTDNRGLRRQQRRRAMVGWGFGVLIVAGTIAAGVFGASGSGGSGPKPAEFTAYDMTQNQYEGLAHGLEEQVFVDRLQKVGLPESLAPSHYVKLFPPHAEDVDCSYWKISDVPEHIARICFSSPGAKLVQKSETYAGDKIAEVEATPV